MRGVREAHFAAELETVAGDPCASVAAELEAERAARMVAQEDLERLGRELPTLRFRNQWLDHELLLASMGTASNGDTPFGEFLRTDEAREIRALGDARGEPKLLGRLCSYLEPFPVRLRPGEATWIAERALAKDWIQYAPSSELAILEFLGPARLTAELPPDELAELRASYADEGVFD